MAKPSMRPDTVLSLKQRAVMALGTFKAPRKARKQLSKARKPKAIVKRNRRAPKRG